MLFKEKGEKMASQKNKPIENKSLELRAEEGAQKPEVEIVDDPNPKPVWVLNAQQVVESFRAQRSNYGAGSSKQLSQQYKAAEQNPQDTQAYAVVEFV
jgi:hypothetical protein